MIPADDLEGDRKTGHGRRDILRGGLFASVFATVGGGLPSAVSAMTPPTKTSPYGGVSWIDPSSVQILFADLQTSLVSASRTQAPQGLSLAATTLAKVASILRIPTLYSVVPEGMNTPTLIPELQPYARKDNTILRRLTSPFMDPPTVAALAKNDRKTLVVAGYAAEVVVMQAVLDAVAVGYTVYYVVDTIGSMSTRTEAAAFHEMDRAGATQTSVLSLTTRLTPDFFHRPGSATFAALQPLLQH